MATVENSRRQRVPASERRDALIEAAIHEFAQSGYHGTPVDRVARRVGVAQPYVFSLFGGKKDLFIAAVERGFELTGDMFEAAAEQADPAASDAGEARLMTMAASYYELMTARPELLMLQLHSYAACADPEIRQHVAAAYARIIDRIQRASGASTEQVDDFMRHGMWLNVSAAMGVKDLSAGCDWVLEEQAAAAQRASGAGAPTSS